MTRIKICGLTREEDIEAVNEAAPDFAGFVFAQSRRRVTPDEAAALRARLRDGIRPVGVFVDAPPEEIAALVRRGILEVIQLHGHETEEDIRALKALTGAPVIKAVRVDCAEDIRRWRGTAADWLLLDNGPGGTGKAFDWTHAAACRTPFFLAGGLHGGNLEQAVAHARPFAVDVSSGAETGGLKDRRKILELVEKVRRLNREG